MSVQNACTMPRDPCIRERQGPRREPALRARARRARVCVVKWYVIQVRAGKDDVVLDVISQKAGVDELEKCFSPKYETQEKAHGQWRYVQRRLTPGYLVAISAAPQKLDRTLREMPEFARLLRDEKGFIPLAPDEVDWISKFTDAGKRVAPMSTAVKEGDQVIVLEGPLFGNAFNITRIDRRRSVAYVQVKFLGRTKEVPLGLQIIAKRRTDN